MWGLGDAGFLLALLLATAAWMRYDEAVTRRRETAEDAATAADAATAVDPATAAYAATAADPATAPSA